MKFRIVRIESSGEKVNYEVATEKIEAAYITYNQKLKWLVKSSK